MIVLQWLENVGLLVEQHERHLASGDQLQPGITPEIRMTEQTLKVVIVIGIVLYGIAGFNVPLDTSNQQCNSTER